MNDVIMRTAIKEDITLGNVVFIKGDDGQLRRKVIEEVLKPSDSFKGFCADDGCRYGLYECYVDDSDTKMTDVKRYVGNEPQCEPAIMVDGKIITVDDYQALQAENEMLKSDIKTNFFIIDELRSELLKKDFRISNLIDGIPHGNKLKADAVREAMDNLLMNGGYGMSFSDAVAALEEYANKLEAGE